MDTSLVMHVMCCFIHSDTTDTGCIKCKMNFDSLLISSRFHDRFWHGNGNRREEVNLQIYRAQLLSPAVRAGRGRRTDVAIRHGQPPIVSPFTANPKMASGLIKIRTCWYLLTISGDTEIGNFPCVTASWIKFPLLLNTDNVPMFLLFLLGPAFNQFLRGAFLPRAPTL